MSRIEFLSFLLYIKLISHNRERAAFAVVSNDKINSPPPISQNIWSMIHSFNFFTCWSMLRHGRMEFVHSSRCYSCNNSHSISLVDSVRLTTLPGFDFRFAGDWQFSENCVRSSFLGVSINFLCLLLVGIRRNVSHFRTNLICCLLKRISLAFNWSTNEFSML